MSQGIPVDSAGASASAGRSRGRGGRGGRGWWRGRGRGWGRGRGQYSGGRGSMSHSSESGPSTSRRPRLVQSSLVDCPYPAWRTYLSDEAYSVGSIATKVKAFEEYFKSHVQEYDLEDVELKGSLAVDYATLLVDVALQTAIPDLASEIRNHPETTLASMALALHTVISSLDAVGDGGGEHDATVTSDPLAPPTFNLPRLYIRLYNYEPVIPLKSLKAPQYGKCVAVQGTVVRVSNIKPLVTKMAFKCSLCQGIMEISLPDGKYTLPAKCLTEDCRGKMFTPLRSSPLTHTTDWQTIRLQELAGDNRREAGRIPRTIECELTADLVDSCIPGDLVTIAAVVKATGSEEGRGRGARDKCMFLLYLHAVSVSNSKSGSGGATSGPHMEFSTKDYYAIEEIQGDRNVFKLIVGSLCPAIYGHEMVKAGLVLGLFGGSQKYADNQNSIPIRGDPHVLVVGDPGLGKSQMLQAAANVAPRGVYVCGNTTTASGLTVTLSKESGGGGGDYALEAGALVLADQGCCCIDEFDKMGSQHQALLEAMEQQSISIAKAGIVCSLPARTSILAAANPIGGHYNKAKTVSENLKMSGALLSRFDLVFILLDKPDEEMDSLLSEHVMSLHAGQRSTGLRATARRTKEGTSETLDLSSSLLLEGEDGEQPLSERLRPAPGETFDPIPGQLLGKYIGYARKYVHPRLSTEAADVLQKFYLELRRQRQSSDSTPITTRQLESLIRLTEARARLELRELASEQDARDVIEIMKFSMCDTYSDEFGMLDFQRSQHGSGMSQRSQSKRFVSELGRLAEQTSNSTFTVQQMKDIAKRIGVQVRNFDDFISSLNNQNYLLKKAPRTYQLQTASCL